MLAALHQYSSISRLSPAGYMTDGLANLAGALPRVYFFGETMPSRTAVETAAANEWTCSFL